MQPGLVRDSVLVPALSTTLSLPRGCRKNEIR